MDRLINVVLVSSKSRVILDTLVEFRIICVKDWVTRRYSIEPGKPVGSRIVGCPTCKTFVRVHHTWKDLLRDRIVNYV